MSSIIGRNEECQILKHCFNSNKAEFVAVYGRRRVGKTFLIKEFFRKRFTFYFSGVENTRNVIQLQNFNAAIQLYGKMHFPVANNWFRAFDQLADILSNIKSKDKKTVFIDELPWLDTTNSHFLQALEYFWNTWASSRPDIMLIVCGSSTSWMINKLLKNRGGLHNRTTMQIHLKPFTLNECELFAANRKYGLNRKQIAEMYMILGGIPYYWDLLKKNESVPQSIDRLFFHDSGILKLEFDKIYNSLFKHSENYITIVNTLAKKRIGLTRDEIVKYSGLSNGGTLTRMLEELEQSSFIRIYYGYSKNVRDKLYQLVDFYSLFYLNFIKGKRINEKRYWTKIIDTSVYKTWCGYAFEMLVLVHEKQIKQTLSIEGVLTNSYSWISKNTQTKAQIDLLIERNDKIINICEVKFSNKEFVIDKKYDETLRNKKYTFVEETKTKNAVHLTMITTYGIAHNMYWNNIQSEVVLDNLFG
ncbi:MAG: ATP-binding protein [Bacteroidales bacterium]|jgi:AAA+ ATPase superfamily predicted ATPase|nr:ATP-binding protein [Bacteroidales bacterium]